MKDQQKSKEQLVEELRELRTRVAELENSAGKHEQTAEELRKQREMVDNIFNLDPYSIAVSDEDVF